MQSKQVQTVSLKDEPVELGRNQLAHIFHSDLPGKSEACIRGYQAPMQGYYWFPYHKCVVDSPRKNTGVLD